MKPLIILLLMFLFLGFQCTPPEECVGSIQKLVKPDGSIEYSKLECVGTCPDESNCTWRLSTNHHGGTREWCGCENQEPVDKCIIVLITPGEGEGGGPQKVVCPARNCPEGTICSLVEKDIKETDEGTISTLVCECKSRD